MEIGTDNNAEGRALNPVIEARLAARAHANKTEKLYAAQDKENPIVFALIIHSVGVRIEARRLILGGYAGAIDAHFYVSWQAIEAGRGKPLETAIDRVAAHLLKGLEGVVQ